MEDKLGAAFTKAGGVSGRVDGFTDVVNLAKSSGLTPATLMGTSSALGTTLTLHPARPEPTPPDHDHDHDHEESGCVCQNCSGNGACGGGGGGKRHRAQSSAVN
ncbi:MAG: hypothetical protein J0M24_23525 [Verrucomicrobia bacterium]|nr:hypothetical protein [Verrucomicrobiota bacterium]